MSYLTLNSFKSDHEVPAWWTPSTLVMDYMDEEPPRYRMVLQLVTQCFKEKGKFEDTYYYLSNKVKNTPEYVVFYKSPQISFPSQADIVLIGEHHQDILCINWEEELINLLTVPSSFLMKEGYCSLKNTAPITGELRKEIFKREKIEMRAQNNMELFGWDALDHNRELFQAHIERRKPDPKKVYYDPEGNETSQSLGMKLRQTTGADSKQLQEKITQQRSKEHQVRLAAMIQSIEQIITIKKMKSVQGKIFVQAGFNHLEKDEEALKIDRKLQVPLTPLYNLLKTLSVIVVCPASYVVEKQLKQLGRPTLVEPFIGLDDEEPNKVNHCDNLLLPAASNAQ